MFSRIICADDDVYMYGFENIGDTACIAMAPNKCMITDNKNNLEDDAIINIAKNFYIGEDHTVSDPDMISYFKENCPMSFIYDKTENIYYGMSDKTSAEEFL